MRKLLLSFRDRLTYRIGVIRNRRALKLRPKQLFSIKRSLVKIHRDLFKIDEKIQRFAANRAPLTPLEKLVIVLEDRRFFATVGSIGSLRHVNF